jgi:TrmH family RNA methyltransferase
MITSPHNPRVKLVRALMNRRKARLRARQCVLEGARLLGDALEAGAQPSFALFTAVFAGTSAGAALLGRLDASGVVCTEVAPATMGAMTGTETPAGILAVCPQPVLAPPPAPTLTLVVDRVADPGNLGSIIRTASAAGVDMVALIPGTVDPFNPKVLRAGMGAHFRVPVAFARWTDLASAPLVLAEAAGQTPYYTFDWTRPAALVIGGEARGISREARRRASASVHIPMARQAESLNAAAAAAVILFEARRQRQLAEDH